MLDKWDYCLRRLFVLKSSELRKALPLSAALVTVPGLLLENTRGLF